MPYSIAALTLPGLRTLIFRLRCLPGIRQWPPSITAELQQSAGPADTTRRIV